jgi:hypothetical protein
MGDKQTKVKIKIDITPAGWANYQIEDMARAAVWVIRKFAATEDVKVCDCSVSGTALEATLEVSSSVAMDSLNGIPAQLRGLAEIPLAPCACGCGVDLSVTECTRDSIEAVKEKRLNPVEKDLAANGDSIGAIRQFRARTGMPLKDAAELVAKHRQALQVAFDAAAASMPPGDGSAIPTIPDAWAQRARELADEQARMNGGVPVQTMDDADAFTRDVMAKLGVIGMPSDRRAQELLRQLAKEVRDRSATAGMQAAQPAHPFSYFGRKGY